MIPRSNHLSEAELDDLLIGSGSPEALLHVASCPPCSLRVEEFQGAVHLFNQASSAWSEAKSNTLSRDLSGARQTWQVTLPAVWSTAATLLLGLAVGLTTFLHTEGAARDHQLTAQNRQGAPAGQVSGDDAMLQAIGSELARPEAAGTALLESKPGATHPLAQVRN